MRVNYMQLIGKEVLGSKNNIGSKLLALVGGMLKPAITSTMYGLLSIGTCTENLNDYELDECSHIFARINDAFRKKRHSILC